MKKSNILKLLIFFLCGMTACGGNKVETTTKAVIKPIKHSKIVRSGNSENQEYAGTVQSSKEAHLSFKVNGNINALRVKVGDKVRKGQLIARMDPTDYQVQVEQSKSNLLSAETQIKSAQSQLVNARANYRRVEKLYENNSVSLSDFEQAKSALETAEAGFEASKAQAATSEKQVEASRNQLAYAQLTAPFSGIITAIHIEENEFVGAGSPIATLNAESQPEVRVGVPEVVISNVKKGQKVNVHFSAFQDANFSGEVSEVGFSTMGGSTYPVIIKIDKPTDIIRPGMAAHVHFDFSKNSGDATQKLYVPVAAVGENANGNFVYKLIPDSAHYNIQKQVIEIGALSKSGFELKRGLEEGDLVATSGLQSLIEGMKVRLMREDE